MLLSTQCRLGLHKQTKRQRSPEPKCVGLEEDDNWWQIERITSVILGYVKLLRSGFHHVAIWYPYIRMCCCFIILIYCMTVFI